MTGSEIAQALATHLSSIPGCRVHAYMPDAFQPPGIVIGLPTISWEEGTGRTFCTRYWSFPMAVVVTRTHDRSAQEELDRLVQAIEDRFAEDITGVDFARLISASPQSISSQGTDYPGYEITVEVIA